MNNKKDIEEDIKAIRKLTGYFEFFLKTIIEDKRFTEIKEKNGITEQKYKKTSFSKAIENILADRERLEKENKQSVSYQALCDYLINSVDETQKPIWTEAHIEELLNNFIVKWKEEK